MCTRYALSSFAAYLCRFLPALKIMLFMWYSFVVIFRAVKFLISRNCSSSYTIQVHKSNKIQLQENFSRISIVILCYIVKT